MKKEITREEMMEAIMEQMIQEEAMKEREEQEQEEQHQRRRRLGWCSEDNVFESPAMVDYHYYPDSRCPGYA